MTKHDQQVALLDYASYGTSLIQDGVVQHGKYYVWHFPTVWRLAGVSFASLLGVDPRATWKEAHPFFSVALSIIDPRHVDDPELATFLEDSTFDRAEIDVCVVPHCTAYVGLLADYQHPASLSRFPHWVKQFIYAVNDVASPDGPHVTGAFCNPTSQLLTINWMIRGARYPLGHTLSPFPTPEHTPWSIPSTIRLSSRERCLPAHVSPRGLANSIAASPWVETPQVLTVINVKDLAEVCESMLRHHESRPRRRHVWNGAVPLTAVPSDTTSVITGYWRTWCEANHLEPFKFHAIWLHKQWAITLPCGIFLNKCLDPTISRAQDLEERDHLVKRYRAENGVSSLLTDHHCITYEGKVFYTSYFLSRVCFVAHALVFEFLSRYLADAAKPENQAWIAGADERYCRSHSQKKPEAQLSRAPNWTTKEDQVIRRYFAPRQGIVNGDVIDPVTKNRPITTDEWEFLISDRSPLHVKHRTKQQIMNRIATINQRAKREVIVGGHMPEYSKKKYLETRLGQRQKTVF